MLPPLPRCSGWMYSSLIHPSHISLPRKGYRVGLHIVLFEACSAFTRVAACTLALSPIRDTLSEGFSHFVTSIAAPVASGWSGCRVGFAPTGKRRLLTAHTLSGHLRNNPATKQAMRTSRAAKLAILLASASLAAVSHSRVSAQDDEIPDRVLVTGSLILGAHIEFPDAPPPINEQLTQLKDDELLALLPGATLPEINGALTSLSMNCDGSYRRQSPPHTRPASTPGPPSPHQSMRSIGFATTRFV